MDYQSLMRCHFGIERILYRICPVFVRNRCLCQRHYNAVRYRRFPVNRLGTQEIGSEQSGAWRTDNRLLYLDGRNFPTTTTGAAEARKPAHITGQKKTPLSTAADHTNIVSNLLPIHLNSVSILTARVTSASMRIIEC